jgi:DNA-binding NarL/FixJ family response regulator
MAGPDIIRVLVAGGRKITREGLGVLLEKGGIRLVGEADDLRAVVRLAQAVPADAIVLNPSSSAHDLPGTVAALREAGDARVVVLCLHTDWASVRELLGAGALGCLARDSASNELIDAIRTVAAGRVYLSSRLAGALVSDYLHDPKAPRRKKLAPREREILRRIANGESTRQIAAALHIGTKTVETHRRRIMEKLQKRSLAELTKYAIREGLSSLEPS